MKLRIPLTHPASWMLMGWALLSLAFPGAGRDSIDAAPHVVSAKPHPFDPDWPEVYWVLKNKCTGCHRTGTERHDLTTYDAIVGGGVDGASPVIRPGAPEQSALWQRVVWNHEAAEDSPHDDEPQMPPDHHEWLTAGQLEALYGWIERGALEYQLPPTCNPRPLMEIDYPSAKECGACHPRQYTEWSRSMHAYAQHSPVFEAFTLTLIERTSGTIGTFCTRCHTPIGISLGETGSTRNVHRSRISMEGITCVVCHRLQVPYYKASARLAVEPGQLMDQCVFGPFDDPVTREMSTHPAGGSRHLQSATFCGACHDVTSPNGVRLEEAFSEWQNSPAAREGITCQECHMGPVQGLPIPRDHRPIGKAAVIPDVDPALLPDRHLSDHTFAGPDYSLLPDTEFPRKLDWMYETDYRRTELLTPHQRQTLDELRLQNREQLAIARAKRHELLRNSARLHVEHAEAALAGGRLRVRVEVESIFAGHNLPTGFTAERQVWVSTILTDPRGQIVYASGDLDENGDLRFEHSHPVETGEQHADYRLLNFQSRFVTLTRQGTERTVVISVNRQLDPLNFVRPATDIAQAQGRSLGFRSAKASLPPLSTAHRTYPIRLPETPGCYHLQVRLNYRNLPPVLLDAVGVPHLKPLLEIVVIDQYDASIIVE
jgi:hypothetical protein